LKSSAKNIKLSSYDDLFQNDETRADDLREKVMEIPLSELFPFKNHPFKVLDDEAMRDTAESVSKYGVLVPAIARLREEGGYELIAGHRRKRACELAGQETMPVIVREMDDDAAVIIMVDSNLQRENILPSERALAYKMKLDVMRRQAGRPPKENSAQLGRNFYGKESREILAEQMGESKNQISRYIRLTELIPEVLDMVDSKKIAFNPAVELSYLKKEEQELLLDAMEKQEATPSLAQAQRLKKYSREERLSTDVMDAIMSEEKKEVQRVILTGDKLKKYFPKSYTPKQIEDTIIKLLDRWQRSRHLEQER
jgi:ParB family chromosome partitioning protein